MKSSIGPEGFLVLRTGELAQTVITHNRFPAIVRVRKFPAQVNEVAGDGGMGTGDQGK